MGFFSKKKVDSRIALVCDIGSASVGAALVRVDACSEHPYVLYQARADIEMQKEFGFVRFLSGVDRALTEVLMRVVLEGFGHLTSTKLSHASIDHALCVLSSPWHTPHTKTIITKFPKETKITEKHLEDILKSEEELMRTTQAENRQGNVQSTSIERVITGSTLNGYSVASPIGKQAAELGASLFISVSSDVFLEHVRAVIERQIHPKRGITFHSFSLVSTTVIRDLFPHTDDFLMVDITGEVTDMTLVVGGVPEKVASFPVGTRTFIRFLAKTFAIPIEEAYSFFHLSTQKKISSGATLKMESAAFSFGEKWQTEFRKTLTLLAQSHSLPADVFLSTDTDMYTIFSDLISNEHGSQILLSDTTFRITLLTAALLTKEVFVPKEATIRDPFLLLEARFLSERLQRVDTFH